MEEVATVVEAMAVKEVEAIEEADMVEEAVRLEVATVEVVPVNVLPKRLPVDEAVMVSELVGSDIGAGGSKLILTALKFSTCDSDAIIKACHQVCLD